MIGEASPYKAHFIASRPPRVGEYVIVRFKDGDVLGMVEQSISGNPMVPESITSIERASRAIMFEAESKTYLKGVIRFLTYLKPLLEGRRTVVAPKEPPDPLSPVIEADAKVLKSVFGPPPGEDGWVKIGSLASNPEVPFYIRVNSIISRHLAILAVTGAGKSNAVSVVSERIVDELGGTVLIFDMHSEYAMSRIASRQNVIKPSLNPLTLSIQELLELLRIPANAFNQERVFRKAYAEARRLYAAGKIRPEEVFEVTKELLEKLRSSGGGRESKAAIDAVLNKLDDMVDRYEDIFNYYSPADLAKVILPGRLNVMDLGSVDEEGADVIVSHYLRRLLTERKRWFRTGKREGYPVPLLTVLEEAHILIPREGSTLTKYWAARVAREGRKFGIGLVLVSQRPKVVDDGALSQTNNKIILRLVEPSDQRYVQAASEQLSDELLELLPGLNVGEAVVVGEMTVIPALVKIDAHPRKRLGADLNAVVEWSAYRVRAEEAVSRTKALLRDIES